MKKLFLFIFTILILFSCKKETDVTQEPQIVSAMLKLKSDAARRITFKTLSNNEKSAFILHHLNDAIESLDLNQGQIAAINDLKTYIRPETFVKDSKENLKAKEIQSSWMQKAKTQFSNQELNYLFSSMGSVSDFKSRLKKSKLKVAITAASEADCNCNTKSDYCSGSTCKASICVFEANACGFLYLYPCDGLCT